MIVFSGVALALLGLVWGAAMLQRQKYQNKIYLEMLKLAKEFLNEINEFSDYITWKHRNKILLSYKAGHNFFAGKTKYYSKENVVSKFNSIYENFEKYIKDYNNAYVKKTLDSFSIYFNDIEGKSLDTQQRMAVVVDEYSNLIIASAGAGKTLTILGKLKYLTEKKSIEPSKILALSYTRKTVNELNERLAKLSLGVKASTFHKLGYDIIRRYETNPAVVTNENTIYQVIKNYLKNGILSESNRTQAFVEFLACYSVIPEEYDKFKSAGERFDTYHGVDYETLKSKVDSHGRLDTLQGERVKSVEELEIANFLYINGIGYEYEKQYPRQFYDSNGNPVNNPAGNSIIYRPDFYLPEHEIWLEHFGINKNGEAKWLRPFEEKKYLESIKDKRQTHKINRTKLLETYSYYNHDNILLSKLETMLREENVTFKRINIQDVYKTIVTKNEKYGSELIELLATFINLCKSRNLSDEEVRDIFMPKNGSEFMKRRTQLFYSFASPIFKEYQETLKKKNEIDFNDMINHATDLVKTKGLPTKYDYVVVDEYQDISFCRFNLINTIREMSDAKLLCVGDDWQSIYRFAGSDISLFSDFEKFAGYHEKLLIERTHRNSQQLVSMSAAFIQKNPLQIKKTPKSELSKIDPINFLQYTDENILTVFIDTVRQIISKYGIEKSILVLGRHTFDINKIIQSNNDEVGHDERTGRINIRGMNNIDIVFSTVHKAKGVEADNVIILNMENSQYGFPNKLTDDPMLSLLLSGNDDYRYAEERRLFYVALTRTKNEVFLLVPDSDESEFSREMMRDNNYVLSGTNGANRHVNCLWCATGKLVIRKNSTTGEKFLGCSHFPHCNQSYKDINILENPMRCDRCGSGFLTKKTGRYGDFLGCTNWKPNHQGCDNTINL